MLLAASAEPHARLGAASDLNPHFSASLHFDKLQMTSLRLLILRSLLERQRLGAGSPLSRLVTPALARAPH